MVGNSGFMYVRSVSIVRSGVSATSVSVYPAVRRWSPVSCTGLRRQVLTKDTTRSRVCFMMNTAGPSVRGYVSSTMNAKGQPVSARVEAAADSYGDWYV